MFYIMKPRENVFHDEGSKWEMWTGQVRWKGKKYLLVLATPRVPTKAAEVCGVKVGSGGGDYLVKHEEEWVFFITF